MSSSQHTVAINDSEEQSVESNIFYFGGPLLGINNPTLPCNSEVLTNSDGTRVAFCVDPRPPATRTSFVPVERESEDLFNTPDLGDAFSDAGKLFENAQTVFQYAETRLDEDVELSSSTSTGDLDMANMEENRNLPLLADAALGTYPQEGQQPAHATTPGDSPRDEEQPADATPADNSLHDDEQPAQVPAGFNSAAITGQFAQVPAIRGFAAINTPATIGGSVPAGFTATNSAATAASTTLHQPVTNQSRRREPRTTGFNPQTGEGMLTHVCGINTPSKGTPVASQSKLKGKFRCPRCNGRYTRPRSVKDHFIKCIEKYGNPDRLSWWDHGTLAATKAWHLDYLPQEEEEEEEEEDNDDEMEEEGNDE